MNKKVTIIMYHYVRALNESRYPLIKGLDLKLFRNQIQFLKNKYNFISCNDLIDSIEGKSDIPENSVLLTFDDGYIDHYTNVLPILLENDIKAFFSMPGKILAEGKVLDVNKIHFILSSMKIEGLVQTLFEKLNYYRGTEFYIPSNLELYSKYAKPGRYDDKDTVFVKSLLQFALDEQLRNIITNDLFKENVSSHEEAFSKELYMSYDQIKMMKNLGMKFGIHGYDHYWLGNLSEDKMKADISKALDVFNNIIDPNNWIMCYPYGSNNKLIQKYIKDNGCKMAITTDIRIADISKDNRFELPRLDTNDFPPKSEDYKLR